MKVPVVFLALALVAMPVHSADVSDAPTDPAVTADLYYRIMLGEIAARRGNFGVALQQYMVAATRTDDPRVAARAFAFAMHEHHFAEAEQAASRWLELAPAALQARQALALAQIGGGRIEQAIPTLDLIRGQLAAQDRQDGFAAIAGMLSQLQDRGVAWQVLRGLRDRHQDSRFAWYYDAAGALAAGEPQAAADALQHVIELAADWAPAYLLRARIQLERGELEAAVSGLQAALERLPGDAQLRNVYARALIAANRLDEADKQFDRIAHDNPKDMSARLALAALASEAKQYDRALGYLQEVLQSGESLPDAWFELGRVEEARGNWAVAESWYRKITEGDRLLPALVRLGALRLESGDREGMHAWFAQQRIAHPDDAVTLYLGEAEVLRHKDLYEPAYAVLTSGLAANPESVDLLYARALVAERLDKLDVTESDLRRVLAIDPEHAQALNALGYTLADRTDRLSEAEPLIRRALEKLPGDAAVLDSMGWVLFRLGRAGEGLPYLQRAHGLSDEPEITAHLIEVLWTLDRHDEARQLWTDASARTPDDRYLLQLKGRLGW